MVDIDSLEKLNKLNKVQYRYAPAKSDVRWHVCIADGDTCPCPDTSCLDCEYHVTSKYLSTSGGRLLL